MTKYIQKEDIVARTVAGENLLVPVGGCTKKVYTLNDVGRDLWEEIEAPRSGEELADSLVERYGIARETALKDARAFLDDMVRKELVVQAAEAE